MADLELRWFIKGVLSETGVKGVEVEGIYRLKDDQDYIPEKVFMHTKTDTTGSPIIIDINDDGISIFPAVNRPQLSNDSEVMWETFDPVVMRGDSIITLDIDQVSGTVPGEDLTVILYLNEI
jgi:hypothetical protein